MKAKFLLIICMSLVFSFTNCKQLKQMAAFSKCEFKLKTIENLSLSGVNVQNVKSISDLSMLDATRLTTAVLTNNFPLQFTLNVDVKNPNTTQASLNKLDWILVIDDIDLVSGTTNNRIQIPPGGVSNYPLTFNFNLRDVLKEKTGQSLVNFGLNLAGAGNQPTRITLKAKPYVSVGSIQIPYPGYINIKNEFTSK